MSAVNSDSIRAGAAGVSAAYIIDNSIRLDKGSSAFMTKTWGSAASSATTMTFSWWQKRCGTGAIDYIFNAAGATDGIQINAANQHYLEFKDGSNALKTTQLYRDPSAWTHIVYRIDTTDSTGGDRFRLYHNGVEVTAFATDNNMSEDDVTAEFLVDTDVNQIGANGSGAGFANMYLAEFIICDGQSLGADSFGESDSAGNWVPIDPSGLTFGNNGFWLDFAVAPGTGNGAGTDVSGNGNHFTDSGLVAADQVLDSPTDDADNNVGNYATWNSVFQAITGVWGNGNLEYAHTSNHGQCLSTQPMLSGKYYFEIDHSVVSLGQGNAGFYINDGSAIGADSAWTSNSQVSALDGSTWYHEGSSIGSISPAPSVGDIIHYAYDADTRKYWAGDGGTWWNSGDPANGTNPLGTFSGTDPVFIFANSWNNAGNRLDLNCGQLTFEQTPPSGFTQRVGTFSTAAPTIKDSTKYYQTNTFTGTGSELARTLTDGAGGAVKPDLVWIKDRDTASTDHQVVDSARGATKELRINLPDAAGTVAEGLKSFDTSGYTLGTDTGYNASSSGQVGYHWVAASGAGSSNEDGSINTITTSVSQTAGFSVSTFTGTGSNATLGHGLGSVPDFILLKARAGSEEWFTWHKDIDPTAPEDKSLRIASNSAVADDPFMQDTMPTSTVMSLDGGDRMNKSGVLGVVYSWTGVEGFSKFGRYEGNGNVNGTFVWLGFRPAFLLLKNFDAASDWALFDNKRNGYNSDNPALIPNEEQADNYTNAVDLLSNGFKTRISSNPNTAHTFIYAAFAEAPFGGSGVSQARAR